MVLHRPVKLAGIIGMCPAIEFRERESRKLVPPSRTARRRERDSGRDIPGSLFTWGLAEFKKTKRSETFLGEAIYL